MAEDDSDPHMVRLTWTQFGKPGESSSWRVLFEDILRLDQEGYHALLGCLAFIICHFGPEAVDGYVQDVEDGRIPLIERIRDMSHLPSLGRDRTVNKISLLRGLLESAGGPVNVYQRNFNKTLTCNENLNMLNPTSPEGSKPRATFGCIDSHALTQLLRLIKPPDFKDNTRGLHRYIEHWKQEITLAVPIGLSEVLSQGVPTELLYNVSQKIVDWFRIEIEIITRNRYRLLSSQTPPDYPILVLVCCCASSCITRCTDKTSKDDRLKDCTSVDFWMHTEEGGHLRSSTRCQLRELQVVDRLDYMIATMIWYHRIEIHIATWHEAAKASKASFRKRGKETSSSSASGSSLVKFDRILDGERLEDSHEIWERMGHSFIKVFGTTHSISAINGTIDRDRASPEKFEEDDDLEQCKEYWRLRQDLNHGDAYRSMRSRMRQ